MQKFTMRTTLTISDELFHQAMSLAPAKTDKADLIRACVQAYIREQSALRLAALGGSIPQMQEAPRRHAAVPETQP